MMISINLVVITLLICTISSSSWMTKEAVEWIIKDFESQELERSKLLVRGHDHRSSEPFVTGNGFKGISHHVCDDTNRCGMYPERVTNGQCIFVKADFFDFFVKDVIPRINSSFIIISHNGDMSTPDGQNDAPRLGYPAYVTSDLLANEHKNGRLIALHAQNLWWRNHTIEARPSYFHCLPIGLENRMNKFGGSLNVYVENLKKKIIDRPRMTIEEKNNLPLLLVAFYPKSRVPDRHNVLSTIGAIPPKDQPKMENPWFNETDLSHQEWIDAISQHKFVLAPFGHGLDTHRIYEILLFGGIPVMRKSTISSCYDDSDNIFNGNSRGSLPIVVLNNWKELTKERLLQEWERISKVPDDHWDWKRLAAYQWYDRLGCRGRNHTTFS